MAYNAAYFAAYRKKNREKIRQGDRDRYAANPEPKKAQSAKRYNEKREQCIAEQKAYAAAHPEVNQAATKRYRENHPDRHNQSSKKYYATHKEQHQALIHQRRAKLRNAPINDFTAVQWREMQEHYNHRCVYCGKRAKGKLTQDHITPISKGGAHTKSNIVPACRSCNVRKHTNAPLVPVQPLLL